MSSLLPDRREKIHKTTLVKTVIKDERGRTLQTRYLRVSQWGEPAGRVDPGESLVDAAARELLERTGYEVDPSDLKHQGIDGEFSVFSGDKSSLTKVAEPGERGGYSTTIRWKKI